MTVLPKNSHSFSQKQKLTSNPIKLLQEAAQGFHQNNIHVTSHPIVIDYQTSGGIKHLELAVMSDHSIHKTIAVYVFQKIKMSDIRQSLPFITKVIYFCHTQTGWQVLDSNCCYETLCAKFRLNRTLLQIQ